MGYAIEAASACKQYAFESLRLAEVYSIIRDNNIPSQKVATRNGMKKIGETIKFYYNVHIPHTIYRITRDEYRNSNQDFLEEK